MRANEAAEPWIYGVVSSDTERMPDGRPVWPDSTEFVYGGAWASETFRSVSGSMGGVAVMGHCLVGNDAIRRSLEDTLVSENGDKFNQWPGSYSTIAQARDTTIAHVDLAGQFPLFYQTDVGGTRISSHASRLSNGSPNAATLAAQIGFPGVTDLIHGRSVFEGVHRLEAGSTLRVSPQGVHIQTYQAPVTDPSLSLDSAAEALRANLLEAIELRVRLGKPMSADFSGGMDSTSLAYLAARRLPRLPVFTQHDPRFPTGDLEYVQRCLALPESVGLEWHEVIGRNAKPFEDLQEGYVGDEPGVITLDTKFFHDYLRAIRSTNSELHLVGSGGDEISQVGAVYLADLLRKGAYPRLLNDARIHARRLKDSPFRFLMQAAQISHLGVADGFSALAYGLRNFDSTDIRSRRPMSWLPDMDVSATWLTSDARKAVADLADASADRFVESDSFDFGNYETYKCIGYGGYMRGQFIRYAAAIHGLQVHTPYFDDAVLRTTLSIAGYKRDNPHEFKPILRRALNGLVPSLVLDRRTKGEYSLSSYEGLQHASAQLHALLKESRLADLGVIEPAAVQASLAASPTKQHDAMSAQIQLNPSAQYRVPKDTYATWFGPGKGTAVLAQTGQYYTLDPLATVIYEVVSGAEDVSVAERILANTLSNMNPTQLREQVQSCIRKLLQKDVLVEGKGISLREVLQVNEQTSPPSALREIPMTYRTEKIESVRLRDYAAALGGFVTMLVFKKSPSVSLQVVQKLKNGARREARPEEVRRLLSATQHIGQIYLGRVACLELSASAAIATALQNKKVDLVIGAATEPNRFHAWLEAKGQPVTLFDDESPAAYQILRRI